MTGPFPPKQEARLREIVREEVAVAELCARNAARRPLAIVGQSGPDRLALKGSAGGHALQTRKGPSAARRILALAAFALATTAYRMSVKGGR